MENRVKHTTAYRLREAVRSWPRAVSTLLALVPVMAFAFIVGNLATESALVIRKLGLAHLFSTTYESVYDTGGYVYGMLPSMWGTALSTLVAIGMAAPVALCLALVSSEFSLGPLSRSVRWILGILSGIPPILYALLAGVVAQVFVRPKFCAWGIPTSDLPPDGMTWWNAGMLPANNSTLLGGMMLGLLVVPFMAPIMDDAIRAVSRDAREASLALGATRWHTLGSVVLPGALSGIVSATALGMLKVMGDLVIIALAVGYSSGLPSPLFDVFEPTATLTSVGAGLLGAFTPRQGIGYSRSAGYFTGLVVFLLATVVLLLSGYLQRKLKEKYRA
jgi:phosphate transport system permease protein